MKKSIFLLLSMIVMFGFMSCATFNDIGSQQSLTIKTKTFETIEGITTVNILKIRKIVEYSHTSTYSLFFNEFLTPEIPFYQIVVLSDGLGW
jgi:hypothetical protein